MTGRLVDMTVGMNGKQRVTVEIDQDFREAFDDLRDTELDVSITKHREKRSLNANAYFHVLVDKIAAKNGMSNDEAKAWLVCRYGTLAKDDQGSNVGLKLPESVDISTVYPYTRWFDSRVENGVTFNCYMLYKRTHTMDSGEMCRLIDGTISEAKELGIVTDTPEQIAKYKELWNRTKNSKETGD